MRLYIYIDWLTIRNIIMHIYKDKNRQRYKKFYGSTYYRYKQQIRTMFGIFKQILHVCKLIIDTNSGQ